MHFLPYCVGQIDGDRDAEEIFYDLSFLFDATFYGSGAVTGKIASLLAIF